MVLILVVIQVLLFFEIIATPIDNTLQATFLLNSLIFNLFIGSLVIKNKNFNPFLINTYVFYTLFFIVAPLIQLQSNNRYLLNGLVFNQSYAIAANVLILISYVTIFIEGIRVPPNELQRLSKNPFKYTFKNQDKIFTKLVVVSIVALGASIPMLLIHFRSSSVLNVEQEGKAYVLFVRKFVMMIPFASLLLVMGIRDRSPMKKKYTWTLVLLIILVFLLKNPINEKRNAIGPIYLTILYYFFQSKVQTNRSFLIVVFCIFVIFFPLTSIVTHTRGDIDSRFTQIFSNTGSKSLSTIIYSHFLEIHYDAWDIVVTIIDYVERNGFSIGYQLLGSVLFFVPRSIWPSKPDGTGTTVVENYVSHLGSTFTNVSSPYLAEGYINFGIVGVILFSFALSKYCNSLQLDIRSNSVHKYFAIYFSFYLFFLLRGDLMNGVAYYTGFCLAYLLLVWITGVNKNHLQVNSKVNFV